jgi:hypothetical protein
LDFLPQYIDVSKSTIYFILYQKFLQATFYETINKWFDSEMNYPEMMELASIAVAALAALLAYFAAREARRSSERSAKASQEISKASLELSKAQQELYVREVRLQYFSELRSWADQAIDMLGVLMGMCHIDPSKSSFNFREMQVQHLNSLSSLIDRGRLFLPNHSREQHGQHKDEAFQGFRHPALDQLVGAFNEGKRISYDSTDTHMISYRALESRKRRFIGIIQEVIETDEWVALMQERDVEQNS